MKLHKKVNNTPESLPETRQHEHVLAENETIALSAAREEFEANHENQPCEDDGTEVEITDRSETGSEEIDLDIHE